MPLIIPYTSGESVYPGIDSLVAHYDAGDSVSWPGSGLYWKNTVADPADGSSQTDNDLYLGSDGSTNAPTFTGSVGSPSAYWSMSPTTGFSMPSNTTFHSRLHWSAQPHTIAVITNYSNISGKYVANTTSNASGTNRGIIHQTNAIQTINAGGFPSLSITNTTGINPTAYAQDMGQAPSYWFYDKDDTVETGGTASADTSSAADATLKLFNNWAWTGGLASGDRVCIATIWRRRLTVAEWAAYVALYQSRFGY